MSKDLEKERARKRAEYEKKKQDPEWLAKRRDYALAYYKTRRASDPEWRERQNANQRARAAANREDRAKRAREYYAAHSEERKAYARAYKEANRAAVEDRRRQKAYRLSPTEYKRLWDEQKGLCAICDQPETATRKGRIKALCIDHCHDTWKVRGLLCSPCNQAIGLLKHDLGLLARASRYLEVPRLG